MSYHCIVLVREVWDTRDLVGAVLDEGNALKESALQTRFEPEDLNALEMALQIKDTHGGKVTAVAIGEPRSVDVLRECLYRGVDEAVRIDEPAYRDLDTTAVAALFASAIKKIGAYDVVFSGVNVVEGENALVGVQVANLLGIDHINYVDSLKEVKDGAIVCKRAVEMGYEMVEAKLPAGVIAGVALLKDDPRTPRSAKAMLKLKLKKAPIPTWTTADLGVGEVTSQRTTMRVRYEAVPQRIIESKKVDAENETELKGMLGEVRGA